MNVDIEALAEYVTLLLEHSDLRHDMGQRARARAEAIYDWKVVIPQWVELWRELCEVAKSIGRMDEDRLDYLKPNQFNHFSHYASRIVGDETPVQMTSSGKDVCAGRAPFFLHPAAQGLISPRHLKAILAAVRATSWLSPTIGQITDSVCTSQGLTKSQAFLHVMWLAKYGLLALCGTER